MTVTHNGVRYVFDSNGFPVGITVDSPQPIDPHDSDRLQPVVFIDEQNPDWLKPDQSADSDDRVAP